MVEKVASLEEIADRWSITDVEKANAVLDMRQDVEREASEKGKPAGR